MKALHPELKRLEAEVASIADFSGMPKAKIGAKAISSVLDAECDSKNANKVVKEALKGIGEAAKSGDTSKAERPKTAVEAIKKMGDAAKESAEKIKKAVEPKKKPAVPAP